MSVKITTVYPKEGLEILPWSKLFEAKMRRDSVDFAQRMNSIDKKIDSMKKLLD